LATDKEFDAIYWNVPFAFRAEGTPLTSLEEAIYDPGYRKNREFITGAKRYLRSGGQILMGVSNTLGNIDAIEAYAKEAAIEFTQIAEMQVPNAPYEILMQLLQARV
jgi:hypothetical protein